MIPDKFKIPLCKLQMAFDSLLSDEIGNTILMQDISRCSPNIISLVDDSHKYTNSLYSQRRIIMEARTCLLNQDWANYYKIIQLMLIYSICRFLVVEKVHF